MVQLYQIDEKKAELQHKKCYQGEGAEAACVEVGIEVVRGSFEQHKKYFHVDIRDDSAEKEEPFCSKACKQATQKKRLRSVANLAAELEKLRLENLKMRQVSLEAKQAMQSLKSIVASLQQENRDLVAQYQSLLHLVSTKQFPVSVVHESSEVAEILSQASKEANDNSEQVTLRNNYLTTEKRLKSSEATLKQKILIDWAKQHHKDLVQLEFAREAICNDLFPSTPSLSIRLRSSYPLTECDDKPGGEEKELRKMTKSSKQVVQQFMQRWLRGYLPTITRVQAKVRRKTAIVEGDSVNYCDLVINPSEWQCGIIQEDLQKRMRHKNVNHFLNRFKLII